MIAITTENENETRQLTLADVGINQPFLDKDGDLCLKISYNEFVIIADCDLNPNVRIYDDVDYDLPILKVLQKIIRWEL